MKEKEFPWKNSHAEAQKKTFLCKFPSIREIMTPIREIMTA